MSNNRKENFDKTKVHRNLEDIQVNNTNKQDTIFGDNNRIKNEMRRKAMQDEPPQKKQYRRTSKDSSLDFDPFETETIYESKKHKKQGISTTTFILITLGISVLICIVVFFFAFKSVLNPSAPNSKGDLNIELPINEDGTILNPDDIKDEIANENLVTVTGVIEKYDLKNNTIKVASFDDDKTYSFIVDGKSKLFDQYGKTIVFPELKEGDIVDIDFDSNSVYISELRINPNSFEYEKIKGVEINEDLNELWYNNQKFKYDENISVFYDDEPFSLSDIVPADIITISGYGNTVYRIDLIKGHGTINFTNTDSLENGIVEIDTDIMFQLDTQTSSNVSAGSHNLVIKANNIDTYTNEVFIEQGDTLEIDLSNLPNKKGLLVINTNVTDPQIMINGTIYSDPIMLPYGNYSVTLSAPDYVTETISVVIDKSQQEVSLDLKPVEKNARIIIDTSPTGAEVYFDNRLIGLTPIDENIEIGNHTVTLRMDGYSDIVFEREFEEQPYNYTFVLTPVEPEPEVVPTNPEDDLIIVE